MRCSAAILASVYNGADNTITLVLIADGDLLVDLSGVTRVVVELDPSNIVDSDSSSAIRWTEQESYRGQVTDVLRLQLGGEGLAVGEYAGVKITVYDSADYLNGIRVENNIKITVLD